MTRRAARRAVAVLALAACTDEPSGPAVPEPTAAVQLCVSRSWVAYLNEGATWRRSIADADGAHRFVATERVVLATADSVPPTLIVEHLTAAQVNASYACAPGTPLSPLGSVEIVLRGVHADGYADVSYGAGHAQVSGRDSVRREGAYPGAHDLVAMRYPPSATRADRIVLRRGQSYAAGARVVVDFDGDEAFAPASHTFRATGPAWQLQVALVTARGSESVMQSTPFDPSRPPEQPLATAIVGLPASRLEPGDLHRMWVTGVGANVGYDLRHWYREPRDHDVVLGPPPTAPTFTTVATTPNVRMRVDMPSQPEYDATAAINLQQDVQLPGVTRPANVWLYASREYFGGTPRTWSMTVPDLRGVPGFDTRVGLGPGAVRWHQQVSSRPYIQVAATDGLVQRGATTGGAVP